MLGEDYFLYLSILKKTKTMTKKSKGIQILGTALIFVWFLSSLLESDPSTDFKYLLKVGVALVSLVLLVISIVKRD